MLKPQSLFLFVVSRTVGATAFYLLAAGVFYWAIADDNHTWPQMSQDGLQHWQTACIWFGGFAIVGLLFLILKEAVKRRNFDLETVNDKTVVESWPTWLLKKGITYIAVVLMIGGGLFLFPALGLMSLPDFISAFQSKIVIAAAGIGAVAVCETLIEVFRRRGMKSRAG